MHKSINRILDRKLILSQLDRPKGTGGPAAARVTFVDLGNNLYLDFAGAYADNFRKAGIISWHLYIS